MNLLAKKDLKPKNKMKNVVIITTIFKMQNCVFLFFNKAKLGEEKETFAVFDVDIKCLNPIRDDCTCNIDKRLCIAIKVQI